MDDIHDGYDRRMQAVKLADVFVIEKVWAFIYEANRQHGDFTSKASTAHLRYNRTRHTTVWSQYHLWDHASNAQGRKAKWDANL